MDIDFPAKDVELCIQAGTGSELDRVTHKVKILEPDRWRQIRQRYEAVDAEHAKSCKYPEFNEWLYEYHEPTH